jgi:PAS domain S-box-containing protein
MVIITDAEANIEYINPRFTEITGYTPEEALGQNPRIMKSGATPQETYTELWRTVTAGKVWHGEFLNKKKSGELYWENASISPIHNEEGAITHYVAVKEDITARKQAELEIESLNITLAARATELEAANKELEMFSFTVSHDLRSPITSINGFSQVLLEKYADQFDQPSIRHIKLIHQEIRRMDAMIKSLLKFSKLYRQELDMEEVDLGPMASTIAMELQLRCPERTVAFSIAEHAHCYGDPVLLRLVMVNLLGNAWKYSAKKELATIEFGTMAIEGKTTFYVRDNGTGFDKAQAGKLFGVFQRLHNDDEFEGYGIGLATVQRIIQRHGGTIYAESEVDKGATFYFTLGEHRQ